MNVWLQQGAWDVEHLMHDDCEELSMMQCSARTHFAPGPKLTTLPPPKKPDQGLASDPMPGPEEKPVVRRSSQPRGQGPRKLSSIPETAVLKGSGLPPRASCLQSFETDLPGSEGSVEDVDFDLYLDKEMDSSFDIEVVLRKLPEQVAIAPNRRTHRIYLHRLNDYLKDLKSNPHMFKFKVIRKRTRDFPEDFGLRARCSSIWGSVNSDSTNHVVQGRDDEQCWYSTFTEASCNQCVHGFGLDLSYLRFVQLLAWQSVLTARWRQ